MLITPNNGLYFPAMDYLYREIMQIPQQEGFARTPLVLNCARLKGLDYTAAKGLSLISSEIQAKNQQFIVLNATEKMRYVCRKSGCKSLVFCNTTDALPAAILGKWGAAGDLIPGRFYKTPVVTATQELGRGRCRYLLL